MRRLPARLASLLAAVAALGGVAGCGDDESPTATAPATAAVTAPAGAPVTAAATAPPETALGFTARLLGGTELDLSTLADQPVVLWFWAPT